MASEPVAVNEEMLLMGSLTKSQFLAKDLNLEKVGTGLYRCTTPHINIGGKSIYGGQVVALGVLAAGDTVTAEFHIHSLHSYFLKRGQDQPILYKVETTREGKTYCSRSVKAIQNGQAIFTMQCSFKKKETDPFSYQVKMPNVPHHDQLKTNSQLLQESIDRATNDKEKKRLRNYKKRIDESVTAMKNVDQHYYQQTRNLEPKSLIWIKIKDKIDGNQHLHRCAASFMSDAMVLNTATLPRRTPAGKFSFFMTSLDHSIWFHNDVQADQWILLESQSTVTVDGRGYCTGRYFSEDGKLLMSIAQEGVVRTMKSNL